MKIGDLLKTTPRIVSLGSADRMDSSGFTLHPKPVRNPSWRRELEKAMRCSDPADLLALVYAAEAALFARCQELSDSPDTIEEREAIRAATNDLLDIKIHRLKWPDFRRSILAVVE